jgi:hypothetical protein
MNRLRNLDTLEASHISLPLTARELTILRYRDYVDTPPQEPRLPPPPEGPLDIAGLSERAQYVALIKQQQQMPPELVQLLDMWLQFCGDAVHAHDDNIERQARARVTVLQDAVCLMWRELHRTKSLVQTFMEQASLVKSLSLLSRFGDYTSVTLNNLKQETNNRDSLRLPIGKKDWVMVDEEIREEEVSSTSTWLSKSLLALPLITRDRMC